MTSSPASPAERLAGLHPSPLYAWCHPCWPPAPAILMHHAHAAAAAACVGSQARPEQRGAQGGAFTQAQCCFEHKMPWLCVCRIFL